MIFEFSEDWYVECIVVDSLREVVESQLVGYSHWYHRTLRPNSNLNYFSDIFYMGLIE
jgi:hypothetical protein